MDSYLRIGWTSVSDNLYLGRKWVVWMVWMSFCVFELDSLDLDLDLDVI